jgi:hypothetical protein
MLMLRDRATPVDLFALVPALALAFAPVLARLDQLLDDAQVRPGEPNVPGAPHPAGY